MALLNAHCKFDILSFVSGIERDRCGCLGNSMVHEKSLETTIQDTYLDENAKIRARIPRDGNCLFRCFAEIFFKSQDFSSNVRNQVVQQVGETTMISFILSLYSADP